MPINLDKFKGRGSDADGKLKNWKAPMGSSKATDGPASDGAITSIDKQVDKASKRTSDSSSDS